VGAGGLSFRPSAPVQAAAVNLARHRETTSRPIPMLRSGDPLCPCVAGPAQAIHDPAAGGQVLPDFARRAHRCSVLPAPLDSIPGRPRPGPAAAVASRGQPGLVAANRLAPAPTSPRRTRVTPIASATSRSTPRLRARQHDQRPLRPPSKPSRPRARTIRSSVRQSIVSPRQKPTMS